MVAEKGVDLPMWLDLSSWEYWNQSTQYLLRYLLDHGVGAPAQCLFVVVNQSKVPAVYPEVEPAVMPPIGLNWFVI